MQLRLPSPKINKLISGIAIGAAFAGSFFVAGIRYEKASIPVRLPANQACLQYAKTIQANLKTFPQIDTVAINTQLTDCTAQSDKYSVTLKATK